MNPISSDIRGNSILELLLQDSSLSVQKLASILKISPRSVEKQLAKLKQDNKISRQGSKKYGTWQVNLKKCNGASHT